MSNTPKQSLRNAVRRDFEEETGIHFRPWRWFFGLLAVALLAWLTFAAIGWLTQPLRTASGVRERVGVADLRRTLMAAGVLNQQFEPKAGFADCFWWTGTAYLVFRHCVPALWFHYRETKRKIQTFGPDAKRALGKSHRQGDLFTLEGGAS